jgi:hypothetical protein
MGRIAGRAAIGLVVGLCLLYFGDWGVWRVRVSRGGGMGRLKVSRFMVAPLKGNKEEYYFDGTAEVACSRSLFPQADANACWWVARNPVVFDR